MTQIVYNERKKDCTYISLNISNRTQLILMPSNDKERLFKKLKIHNKTNIFNKRR